MLGVCCHWVEMKSRPRSGVTFIENMMEERLLQLGRYRDGKYTEDAILATYRNNAQNLLRMLPLIRSAGVRLFRISSTLFPLADQVDRALWDNDEIRGLLASVGQFILAEDMRVTTHPGQFCVLSSDSDRVVENANTELAMHGWLFDAMGLPQTPQFAINIHGGKGDRASLLVDRILSLPPSVRGRLTLENDETTYTVSDLAAVSAATGVPVTFDSHHHVFNEGGLSLSDALYLAAGTWPRGIKPLQHISNTSPGLEGGSFTERRKHSDMIHYVPEPQLALLREDLIDVEVEAKWKNLSVLKMSQDFQIPIG